jgi:hypothetical protein
LFFFALSSVLLAVVLLTLIVGAAGCGLLLGRSLREKRESVSESFGVLQAALLGFMGLILAFGLSLAIGRYDTRRQAVVDDANAIGTTYLRAQTLAEPLRSRSLALLVRYTDVELRLSHVVPGSTAASRTVAQGSALQRQLWSLAAQAVQQQPVATAPRLYEDSLNAMIDEQAVRVAGLSNRVPTEVLLLEIIGARNRAGSPRAACRRARPRYGRRAIGGGDGLDAALRHLRSGSPDPWTDPGARHLPRPAPRLREPATRGRQPPMTRTGSHTCVQLRSAREPIRSPPAPSADALVATASDHRPPARPGASRRDHLPAKRRIRAS